jgi:hypothetical protein
LNQRANKKAIIIEAKPQTKITLNRSEKLSKAIKEGNISAPHGKNKLPK